MTKSLASSTVVKKSTTPALDLLLQEDPLLSAHNLTNSGKRPGGSTSNDVANEDAAFSYAAALLHDDSSGWMSSSGEVQKRAAEALAEVDRKLALVEGLAERVARDHPEDVASPFVGLHGHHLKMPLDENATSTNSTTKNPKSLSKTQSESIDSQSPNSVATVSLFATREKCDRLRRQGVVLEGIAKRVESSLQRGLRRMESTTSRLSRLLEISATLKMAMRLRFEAKKIQGSCIDFDSIASNSNNGSVGDGLLELVDLRDLTRAAASVSTMEHLLSDPQLRGIDVVEQMRLQAETAALAVRRAAAGLLAEQQQQQLSSAKLGSTLQVYFHLGELPQAAWSAVAQSLATAEKAASQFFNPGSLQRLNETAVSEAKFALDVSDAVAVGVTEPNQKKTLGESLERATMKKLKIKRAEAASKWAHAVGDAAFKVWNLHRVLARKSDASTRQNFLEVVSKAPIPEKFQDAEKQIRSSEGGADDAGGGGIDIRSSLSLFSLFWNQMCILLGMRIQRLLKYDNGKLVPSVSALYPAVRAAALDMLGNISDSMQAGLAAGDDPSGGASSNACGILGGSTDDSFFMGYGNIGEGLGNTAATDGSGGGFLACAAADSWTRDSMYSNTMSSNNSDALSAGGGSGGKMAFPGGQQKSISKISSVIGSEWKILLGQGNCGLYPLQRTFLEASNERLCAPLQYLFPVDATVEENGVALEVLPILPSRYDLAKIEANIREELTIADPRQGGGELGMTAMISRNAVEMIEKMCAAAKSATSNAGEDGYSYLDHDSAASELLIHDMKLAGVIHSLSVSLKKAPENAFVIPYRPAQSAQHEEAARMCQIELQPAQQKMHALVLKCILSPLCRALNARVSSSLSKMHLGAYLEDTTESDSGGFVQTHLNSLYEKIATDHISRLPSEYGSIVSICVATYSIYAFVSNAVLVRPLGEMGRLRITQDLANLELALEQLVFKAGSSSSLAQMDNGKAYAELRAVRQMLFWSLLSDDESLSPSDIAKSLLRETWIVDVRPSTICHFLFSFAPNLLSSPHHAKRMSTEDFVHTLVQPDGSIADGEANAWMTIMSSCDSYQQRDSVDSGMDTGDRRIPAVLMYLAPELIRRRRF
eukprot:CAMPEP_0194419398 /NCGR_PEP_ID=MMETSP0176-20130528/18551_1 /TAXON_ID=216777 /ORGANISM="Proboscia alata, Strain PI-D3" /LENGTH=1108 /DNA_ID=CAMNT_0039226341 /DNA_START=40 /DNA_END=3366 /DNA_ORIENTATION=-